MAARTTTEAYVLWNGQRVAKITSIDLNVSRQNIDDTGIGQTDHTFVYGDRTTTASGTLLYDPEDPASLEMMNRIADNRVTTDELRIVSKGGSAQGDKLGTALISQASVPISVGALMSCRVEFSISGGFAGDW